MSIRGILALAGGLALLNSWHALAVGPFFSGFDFTNSSIPVNEIVGGGPARDGIPSINNPQFVTAAEATFLEDSDLVIGLSRNGVVRAYPLRIMLWHEVVNDRFGDEPLAVTYCPLCGTAVVFEALVNGQTLSFGVSGLLYQSDVLMYDRQTESLWSQLLLRAVTGPQLDQPLKIVPSQVLTWAGWRKKFPNTQVLSTNTGFTRDYSFNPYSGYERSQTIWFGVPVNRKDFDNKDLVLGVLLGQRAKAYAIKSLESFSKTPVIDDEIDGTPLRIQYDPATREPAVLDAQTGEPYPFIQSFWFAWQAFYPETDVWAPARLELHRDGQLRLSGEKNRRYTVEMSSNLKTWLPVDTATPTNGIAALTLPALTDGRMFYRARREP